MRIQKIWHSLKNEFKVNDRYFRSLGLQKQTLVFLGALASTPLSVLLYWLRAVQFEISWGLYKLYVKLRPSNALLAFIPFIFLAILNGSSFSVQYFYLKGSEVIGKIGFVMNVLGMPLWIGVLYYVALLEFIVGSLGFGAGLFVTVIGNFLALLLLAVSAIAPLLISYLRVGAQDKTANIAYFLLAGVALCFTYSISLFWALGVAWFLLEPLFLMHKPLNPAIISFKDDVDFNDQAIVEVLFHKKMLQLRDYWVLDSYNMRPVLEKLFERFFVLETDPAVKIRFLHHFLAEVKLHRKLTQEEYACILRNIGVASAPASQENLEDVFSNFQFNQALRDHVVQPSTLVCEVPDPERSQIWIDSMQHTNPYQTYLEECKALLKAVSPVYVAPQQQGGSEMPALKAFFTRFNEGEPMTDQVREDLHARVREQRQARQPRPV